MMFMRADRHLIRETEAGRFFRRDLNMDDLFTFWNRETNAWVLAYWVNKDQGVAEDVEDIDGDFETGPILSDKIVGRLRAMKRKPNYEQHKKRLIEDKNREFRRYMDTVEKMRDERNYLKRATGNPNAGPFFH